jgi:hypothetical protein
MQFIIFIYKEFHPILLSGLKIERFQKLKCVCGMSVIWLKILRNFWQWRVLKNDAIWNVYNFFFHSKESMHEIEVWCKKSRTKRFGNFPRLGPGTIIQQNNLLTLKKNKGNESFFFSRLKRRIGFCHSDVIWRQKLSFPTSGISIICIIGLRSWRHLYWAHKLVALKYINQVMHNLLCTFSIPNRQQNPQTLC